MPPPGRSRSDLAGLGTIFLKLGFLGFGGPAAHIALLEDEVVARRQWLTRKSFLDLVGATHLIPGPNSTEMAIHIGLVRAGIPGMLVAGASFIVPAVLITGGFAWAYERYGSLPEVSPFLAGIQPAVLAVIFAAVLRLGRQAISSGVQAAIAAAVALAAGLGAGEIWALLGGAVLGMFAVVRRDGRRGSTGAFLLPWGGTGAAGLAASAATTAAVSTWKLGLFFLKVGAVLYGGGYVLIAFLEGELVRDWGWLTERELLDAIAVGQFTPGPILSTATFVGYLLGGIEGAAVSTVAIFLPSFIFVLLLSAYLPRLRRGRYKPAFLDAVNASAVGLMVLALVKLAMAAVLEPRDGTYGVRLAAVAIAFLSAAILFRFRPNPAWIVLGGAAAGWALSALGAA